MTNNLNTLSLILQRSCSSRQWQQFSDCQKQLKDANYALPDLQIVLAMLRRKVGSQTLATSEGTYDTEINHWKTDELARVYSIITAQRYHPHSAQALLDKLYTQGDEYEREAILKGFLWLDSKGKKADLAIEATRTNIVTLFSAISQYNAYPAQNFSEQAFNQLVLKTLFLNLNLHSIIGLKQRLNASLSRMCFNYLREQMAATRNVPTSIWQAINLQFTPEAEEFFIRFLNDTHSPHRMNILSSLKRQNIPIAIQRLIEKQAKNRIKISE